MDMYVAMIIVFELLKIFFYFMTVVLGVFKLRGDVIFGWDGNVLMLYRDTIQQVMMPWYLLLCGLMIGYLVSRVLLAWWDTQDDVAIGKIYIQSFLGGLILGIILAGIWLTIW